MYCAVRHSVRAWNHDAFMLPAPRGTYNGCTDQSSCMCMANCHLQQPADYQNTTEYQTNDYNYDQEQVIHVCTRA